MRPHGPAGVVFVADHLCIKKRNNLVLLLITCVQKKTIWFLLLITCVTKKNNLVFVFNQMVSRCQRRCIRVLCSRSCDFLLFHMCSARSPQLFSNGLAHFPCRLCKSHNIFPAWLSSRMVLAQHFCIVCLLAS